MALIIPIPITAANGILFILELIFAYFCYPRLIHHGDYIATYIRLKRNGCVRPGTTQMRELAGGVDLRLVPLVIHVTTILIGLALVFSLEPTKLPVPIHQQARLVTRKTNFSSDSSRDIKCAAETCLTLLPNSSNVYRPFVVYRDYPDRLVNTDGDKRCGSMVISCIGKGIGNTLPKPSDKLQEERVHVVCCKYCQNRSDFQLFENFTYTKEDGSVEQVELCSTDNTSLMKKAFERLRNHKDKTKHSFNVINEDILPGMMYDLTETYERRTFISGEIDGTEVQPFSSVIIIVAVLVVLHVSIVLFNFVILGKSYVHHGTSDMDIRTLYASILAHDEDDNDTDEEYNYFERVVFYSCDLYGKYSCKIVRNDTGVRGLEIGLELPTNQQYRICPICTQKETLLNYFNFNTSL